MCYLISYTRLFMKLNLFKILFYITFITTNVSRSTVQKTQQANAVIKNNKTAHELWCNCSSYGHNIEHNE